MSIIYILILLMVCNNNSINLTFLILDDYNLPNISGQYVNGSITSILARVGYLQSNVLAGLAFLNLT